MENRILGTGGGTQKRNNCPNSGNLPSHYGFFSQPAVDLAVLEYVHEETEIECLAEYVKRYSILGTFITHTLKSIPVDLRIQA